MSLYAAKLGSNVIAVEPEQNSLSTLLRNIELNGLQDRITVLSGAIGARTEIVEFGGSSTLGESTASIVGGEDQQFLYRTPSLPITFLGELIGAEWQGLVKIDIEGGEWLILGELVAFLNRNTRNLLISFHDNNAPDNRIEIIRKLFAIYSNFENEHGRIGNPEEILEEDLLAGDIYFYNCK
jgi:FkbM family methyltransferase